MAVRRNPNVRRNPPRGSVAPRDSTRDARDDATIISWLSQIDKDILARLKQPVAAGNKGAQEKEVLSTSETITQVLRSRLEDLGKRIMASLRDLGKMLLLPMRLLSRLFTSSAAASGATTVQPENRVLANSLWLRARSITTNGRDVVRRMGESLRGTTAETEVSWENLKAGIGRPPPIRPGGIGALTSAVPLAGRALGGASNGLAGVGSALTAVGALAVAFVALAPEVAKFGEGVLEANRKLAEASPSMGFVFASKEFRDTLRDIRIGEATAQSAKDLADAVGDFKDQTQGFKAAWQNFKNRFSEFFYRLASNILRDTGLGDAAKHLAGIEENTRKEKFISTGEWLEQIAKDTQRRRNDRDPHFDRVDRREPP